MFTVLGHVVSLFQRTARPQDEVAHDLMERAEARAGLDPRQAQELRRAAQSFISVLR